MIFVLGVIIFVIVLGVVGYAAYRRILRKAKSIERGLKMVPIRIHLPASQTEVPETDPREQMRRRIGQAETLYSLVAGSTQKGFKSNFYGQRHVSFEIVATDGAIHFYVAVPVALVPVVQQAVLSAYPTAQLEEVEDYNPFSEQGKIPGTVGGELILKEKASYPLLTYNDLETDPLEALLNTLSSLKAGEGAAVQVMIRPADKSWVSAANKLVQGKRKNPTASTSMSISPKDVMKAAVKTAPSPDKPATPQPLTGLEEATIASIEEKAKHPGFETLIRLIVSSDTHERSQAVLTQMATAFALLEAPGRNGLKLITAGNIEGLVTAFIFRFFPPELKIMILNTVELATIFHLPDAGQTATAQVERQQFHEVDGPINLPKAGLLFGYNTFRGVNKEVRLDLTDRQRHTYIVGQTGTGKSTLLENLAVQDMLNGDGFAFIDPHGDTAERILSMVPKHRAEDIIYFNPGDTSRPLGLNLFEFSDPAQKDFLVQESLAMLYKLYDPGKTGIIGPRFEQWYRNAALTLMSDPAGSTFIEIPKVFTDDEYLKQKFKYVQDQTVIDFWTKEMAQTSDYHKSEMLGWFVSKFGAFMSNEIMRDIIGQTKSSFNLRDIMDNKKILIVNLSKGLIGELNSQLLGMVFVIKFQAAAMSRANVPEAERNDFCLYVDEFQNFATDSFATILSEARKYRLNLTVANQFIGQLSEDVRNAVFGNVGTIASFRTGPEDAEFLVKQFAPVFDVHDLVNIPNGHAVMRLMVGGLPSQPFSIHALPPIKTSNPEMADAVKQLSAAKFGTTKAQVELDIAARMTGQPVPAVASPAEAPMTTAPGTSEAQAAIAAQLALQPSTPVASTSSVAASSPDTLDIKPLVPATPPPEPAVLPPAPVPTPALVPQPEPQLTQLDAVIPALEPVPLVAPSAVVAAQAPEPALVIAPPFTPTHLVPDIVSPRTEPAAPTTPAVSPTQPALSTDSPKLPQPAAPHVEKTERHRSDDAALTPTQLMRHHTASKTQTEQSQPSSANYPPVGPKAPQPERRIEPPEQSAKTIPEPPLVVAAPIPAPAPVPTLEPQQTVATQAPAMTAIPTATPQAVSSVAESTPAPTASKIPKLQPGEVHVDEDGNVTIGT